MLSPTFFAVLLAAVPSVYAQSNNNTSTVTRCTTRFGFFPLPTGSVVPTWYSEVDTTNTFLVTTTLQDTITVTPNATVCGGMITETSTVTTTSITTPPATTIPARVGQLPLLNVNPTAIPPSNPTPIPRIKRLQVSGLEVTHLINRQTAVNNTGGFVVNPDGSTSNLNRIYPRRVFCERRRIVSTTSTVTVTAAPTTVELPPATATAYSTTTITTTLTVIQTAPTPRVYAACGGNNVVNQITDSDGARMNFQRVAFAPQEGLPIANELVVNTTGPIPCCNACQDTPNCAGSFYVPSQRNCHIRLTAPPPPPPVNSTLGLPSGNSSTILPSGTGSAELATTTATSPGTCDRGSETLYLGTIRGKPPSEFRDEFAVFFSNGPCGRFSVSPLRVREGTRRAVAVGIEAM